MSPREPALAAAHALVRARTLGPAGKNAAGLNLEAFVAAQPVEAIADALETFGQQAFLSGLRSGREIALRTLRNAHKPRDKMAAEFDAAIAEVEGSGIQGKKETGQ